MKRLLALLCALMMLSPCALAQSVTEAPEPAVISAVGEHAIALEADGAVLTFALSAFDETLAEAEKLASAKADGLKYALLSAGAQATEITVRRSDVQNVSRYQYNKLQEPTMERAGCTVSSVLQVRLTDVSRLSGLIDTAVTDGRYESYEVALSSSRAAEAYQEALALAAQAAREKALALAKACGVKNAAIHRVTELPAPETDGLTVAAQVEVSLRAEP